MVSASKVILLRATTCSALFRVLSPPRLSLWRTVLPEEAGIGLTPAKEAKAASDRTRPFVRPGGKANSGGDGSESCFPQQWRRFADFDQFGDSRAVSFDVRVEVADAFGQPDCFGAGNGQCQWFFTDAPP